MKQTQHLLSRSEASSQRDFATRFAQVQEDLRQDPYRMGLPGVAFGARFAEIQLPISSEFWILEDQTGQNNGRIAANLSPVYPNTGYLGFFEADSFDAAKSLIEGALGWLKERGAQKVYGPINFNTWLPYRFRIEEDDSPSFGFEPNNPPTYPLWFRELGFQMSETYHSDGIDGMQGMIEVTQSDYENALSLGYTFRNANTSEAIESELQTIYQMNLKTFQSNFLFEPIPFELFRELYVPSVQKTQHNAVHFICDPKGHEVGYFSTFIESNHLILKTLALAPEGRGLRLSNALLHFAVLSGCEKGATRPVPALIRDGIQSESYSRKQKLIWRHRYALFEKDL